MAKLSLSVNKVVKQVGQAEKASAKITPHLSPALSSLLKRANSAYAQFKYGEAYDLFTRAIDSGELDPARKFDARNARRDIFWRLRDPEHQRADLQKMARLARLLKDPVRQARLAIGQAMAESFDNPQLSASTAQAALRKARKLKEKALEPMPCRSSDWPITTFIGDLSGCWG